MKDIFFGSNKHILRYAYLRRDAKHMETLLNSLNKSKLIIFKKVNRLEVLLNSNNNKNELIPLNVKDYPPFKQILSDWIKYNIRMEEEIDEEKSTIKFNEINKINDELNKISLFWLGMDDNNVFTNINGNENPIYSIDITKSEILSSFVEEEIIKKSNNKYFYSNGMKDVLVIDNSTASAYSYCKMFIEFLNKNNYCPSCGSHVVPVQLGSKLHCLNDSPYNEICKANLTSNNFQFPRTDPVVIISLSDENGRILLGANRKRHPPTIEKVLDEKSGNEIIISKTMFSCFAGFMEPGETIESTCVREVYEETGLKLKLENIQIIQSQPWPYPSNLMIGCIGILTNDQINDSNINTELDKELDQVQWFNFKDVNNVLNGIEGILSKDDNKIDKWSVPPIESIAGRLLTKSVNNCKKLLEEKL